MERGEGERLHAQRRRRFWLILGGLAGIGMVAGFLSGFVKGYADGSGTALDPTLVTVLACGVVLAALVTAYGSWRFFVTVDEVEVADNLWGSLIGFYVYAILFPSWWALNKLERAPEVDHWLIFGASMLAATAAYAVRKWRSLR